MQRNNAFFSLYENVILTYKELHGEKEAIAFARRLFSRALGPAYDAVGFEKGSPNDFARAVQGRDNSVGLAVELPVVGSDRIVYRFLDDPFPGLKGKIDKTALDRSYLDFKVSYLLGDSWRVTETTKHLWDGDPYSEHIIERK